MMMQYCILLESVLFFFFKQKTAYEMRISDWSSDVCSSDLAQLAIDGNYGWFAILQSNQDASRTTMGFVQTNTYWNGHGASSTSVPFLFNVEFPRNEILVNMFSRAPPPEALDAIFIYQSITQKDRKSTRLNSSH